MLIRGRLMELYQLRTFVAVAEAGSLSGASKRLFTSLPAMSAQIKSLEDELGVLLFERTPKGMTTTEAGALLLVEARAAVQASARLKALAGQSRDEASEPVRIGVISNPAMLRLDAAMAMLAAHRHLALHVEHDTSGNIISRMVKGDLDCGFVIADEVPAQLCGEELTSVELAVGLPAKYSAVANALSPVDLADIPWITSSRPCAFHRPTQELFKTIGVPPRSTLVADAEGNARSMVASGLGAAVLRLREIREASMQQELVHWPHWTYRSRLYLLTQREYLHNCAVTTVRNAIVEAWRNIPPGAF